MKKENAEKREFVILVILFIIIVILGALFVYNRFFAEHKQSAVGEITDKEEIVNYYDEELDRLHNEEDEQVNESCFDDSDTGLVEVTQSIIEYTDDNIKITLGDSSKIESNNSKFLYLSPKIEAGGNNTKYLIYYSCDYGSVGCNFDSIRITEDDYIEDNIHIEDMEKSDYYMIEGKSLYDASSMYWMNSEGNETEAHVYLAIIGIYSNECFGIFDITIDCSNTPMIKSIDKANIEYSEDSIYSNIDKMLEYYGFEKSNIVEIYSCYVTDFMSTGYYTYNTYSEMPKSYIDHNSDNMLMLILVTDWGGRYEVYLEPDTFEVIAYKTMKLSSIIYSEVLENF